MNKLIALFVVLLSACFLARTATADDICFIGSASPLTGAPGSAMAATSDNQPILDEASAIQSAFAVASPLFESDNLYDFSSKAGNVYIAHPLIEFLVNKYGTDPSSNGVGFVVAHEYAHQLQFKVWSSGHDAQTDSILQAELQADIIAASWFGMQDRIVLGQMRRQIGPSFDRQMGIDHEVAALQQPAIDAGNYLAWTPEFHGTDDQRKAAIKVGVQYGEDFYQALPAGAYQTYANEIYDFSKQAAQKIIAVP